MKRTSIVIGTIILSLLIVFLFAKVFSLYHFGDAPTITSIFYLITSFFIIEYIFLSVIYEIYKKVKREKIWVKKIISLLLFLISLLLLFGFVFILNFDWIAYYSYVPCPFYLSIIKRSLEFLLPSFLLVVVGFFILRKER